MSGPGTKIVAEIDHERVVGERTFQIREIHWNGTSGISVDVYLDGELLTEAESLDDFPTDDELRALLPFAERIRTIRRELTELRDAPELAGSQIALERVLDAWDEFEYGVGTAEGGEREVIS